MSMLGRERAQRARRAPAFAPKALRRVRRSFSGGGNGAGEGVPASERVGGSGPPSPLSGFGEVSPEPARTILRTEADGAKPPGRS